MAAHKVFYYEFNNDGQSETFYDKEGEPYMEEVVSPTVYIVIQLETSKEATELLEVLPTLTNTKLEQTGTSLEVTLEVYNLEDALDEINNLEGNYEHAEY